MAFKISLFDTEYDCIGTGSMSLEFIRWQLECASGDDIEIDISSLGGSHFDAVALYDLLKKYAGNVHTICISVAGSAAATVFAAGSKRTMSKYSLLMIHPASIVTAGDSKSLITDSSMVQKCTDNVIAIWADVTGLDIEKVTEMVNNTTWLSAEEALALKFCTDVEDYAEEAGEPVKNAAVVLNRIATAPLKYKQVINHILVKQPETAQIENEMTKEEIEAIVNKNDGALAKVMNFFKLSTNKLTTNKGDIFFVGNLVKGTKVFNSAELETAMNDDDIEVEDSASNKKVTMSVKNGAIENIAGVANAADDDEMDDDELDAENKAEPVKNVLNQHGIQLKKSVGTKKVMNATIKKLAEVTKADGEKAAMILELRDQLKVSNAAVKLTEDEVKDQILSTYKPENQTRQTRTVVAGDKSNIKQPAEGSLAANAAMQAVKNKGIKTV